ncbi:conserved hypothetical protein [Ricinus communis]|uniref:Uncharacterized protein n=1 Tax=Ricinus communis TaxID=3988 RepID=B9RUX1_RICCO|nr:conserved hypothetical protein [Ricinus communis]
MTFTILAILWTIAIISIGLDVGLQLQSARHMNKRNSGAGIHKLPIAIPTNHQSILSSIYAYSRQHQS